MTAAFPGKRLFVDVPPREVCSTPAIQHRNPDVGARHAVPRLGEASLAPTIDMFNCLRNNMADTI